VLKILRYTLASSFPETKFDKVKMSVIPFGERRALIGKFLTATINRTLLNGDTRRFPSEKSLDDFHAQARSIKCPSDGKTRHVSKVIVHEIAVLTGKSDHGYLASCMTTADLATHTRYCDRAEWDTMVDDILETERTIARDISRARETLHQMTDV